MEVFKSVQTFATSTTYDYFPYDFEIVQAYFPIFDN
jgi:hypothetical protein